VIRPILQAPANMVIMVPVNRLRWRQNSLSSVACRSSETSSTRSLPSRTWSAKLATTLVEEHEFFL
jgi:hypothetical protein